MRLFVSLSRNALNVDELKAFLESYHVSDVARKWLGSNVRRWAIENALAEVVIQLDPTAPEWARNAFESGQKLYKIDLDALKITLDPVVDWLRHADANRISYASMSVPAAIQASADWHAKLAASQKAFSAEDGVRTIKTYDSGFFWVEVYGRKSLKREGEQMGHCVGDYYEAVRAQSIIIYSLRDAKNVPHVTIEVEAASKAVNQIKGTANEDVIAKYEDYCLDFLGFMGFPSVSLDGLRVTKAKVLESYETYKTATDARKEEFEIDGWIVTNSFPARPQVKTARVYRDRTPKVRCIMTSKKFNISLKLELDHQLLWTFSAPTRNSEHSVALKLDVFNGKGAHILFDAWRTAVKARIITPGTDVGNLPALPALSKYFQEQLTSELQSKTVGSLRMLDTAQYAWVFEANYVFYDAKTNKLLAKMVNGENNANEALQLVLEVKNFLNYVDDFRKLWPKSNKFGMWSFGKADTSFYKAYLDKGTPKSEQAVVGTRAAKTKVLTYKDLKTNKVLKNALRPYVKSMKALEAAAVLVKGLTDVAAVRSAVRRFAVGKEEASFTSGTFLYDAFDLFFLACVLPDKEVAKKMVLNTTLLQKLLVTFAVMPSNLQTGAWFRMEGYKRNDRAVTLAMFHKSIVDLPTLLPSLLPFTEAELKKAFAARPALLKKMLPIFGY